MADSPVQESLADLVATAGHAALFGVACCGLSAVPQLGPPFNVAVGGTCALLAARTVAAVVGPSLGEVAGAFAFELERRREEAGELCDVTQSPSDIGEEIRLVPLRGRGVNVSAGRATRNDVMLCLPDGRKLRASKLAEFVAGATVNGLGAQQWKRGRRWSQADWETARDMLALYDAATPRTNGKAGEMLMSPGRAMRAMGL